MNFKSNLALWSESDFDPDFSPVLLSVIDPDDANGNQTEKTVLAKNSKIKYAYNSENQLIKTVLPNGTTVECKYDEFGRRVEKFVGNNFGGNAFGYVYDNEDILAILNPDNSIRVIFTHGPGIDEPLMMKDPNFGNTTLHADGLGSIVAHADLTGTVIERMEYEAYGTPKFIDVRGSVPVISSASFTFSPYAYTGREWDGEMGLYFYRTRTYDSGIGRFMTEDSIGFASGDENFYAYALDNPVNYIDPTGEFWNVIIGAGTSVAAGYVIARLTDQCYGWKDVAVDAALGATGTILIEELSKTYKVWKLRKLANERELEYIGTKGYTEIWQKGKETIKIKFRGGISDGLHPNSKVPRFSYRLSDGIFKNPFSGEIGQGPKSALGHIPLGITESDSALIGSVMGGIDSASGGCHNGCK